MKLTGGWVALSSQKAVRADLEIQNGRVERLVASPGVEDSSPSSKVNLEGYLILPGLINAHDHLEFNLFPRLGNGPYSSSREWARDIYRPERSPLREHCLAPKSVRLWWGGIKNLLSGVTTVCHHNPYDEGVFEKDFPVNVVKRYGWAHSLTFGNDPREAFESTPDGAPFIIHLAEGTDSRSKNEIFVLDQLGILDSRTVVVHGVALTARGHALRRQRGASLVWCPTSNRFTLGATLAASSMCRNERVALGSDSALTARGDLLDEINSAHGEEGAAPDDIYSMVTESAAHILRLCDGEGSIRAGGAANLIAIRWDGSTPAESLVRSDFRNIELVIVGGRPNLFSTEMATRWPQGAQEKLEWITVGGNARLVRAPVRNLLDETIRFLPDGIRLAGREVSA